MAANKRVESDSRAALATMTTIPGFWDIGPHDPLDVEPTWDEFVLMAGGRRVVAVVPAPAFENADYIFQEAEVVAELKQIETEFTRSSAFRTGFDRLMKRVVAEDPSWRPLLFGGDRKYPQWFAQEFLRLFRPPLSRTLKKANRQIRDTKKCFAIDASTGVLFLVNDGFTAIGPEMVQALCANLLIHSYSSIDCVVYVTVNRHVEIKGSDVPRLIWSPTYSDRAPDSLVSFIDNLGRHWRRFLHTKIGPFTIDDVETPDHEVLRGSKSIVLPGEHRG